MRAWVVVFQRLWVSGLQLGHGVVVLSWLCQPWSQPSWHGPVACGCPLLGAASVARRLVAATTWPGCLGLSASTAVARSVMPQPLAVACITGSSRLYGLGRTAAGSCFMKSLTTGAYAIAFVSFGHCCVRPGLAFFFVNECEKCVVLPGVVALLFGHSCPTCVVAFASTVLPPSCCAVASPVPTTPVWVCLGASWFTAAAP